MASGVYKITSKVHTDRIYIGSAQDLRLRENTHFSHLLHQYYDNIKLQRHYNKYGKEDLEFVVIEECPVDQLLEREQCYLNELKPWFNVFPTAGSPRGTVSPFKGKKRPDISLAKLGHVFSDESRKKMSDSHKGQVAWNKGKTGCYSKDVLAHWSKIRTGRKQTPESIAKTATKNTGKKRTPEFCLRQSEMMKGNRGGKRRIEETELEVCAVMKNDITADVPLNIINLKTIKL